jgi:hypothetical protein
MNGKNPERWQELCEQAAKEQDPQKLLVLTQEINRLLQEKEQRRHKTCHGNPSSSRVD